jgi:AraC family transcriptional regulator of adaptative response / DNA-3-methyladenine glycosylase II
MLERFLARDARCNGRFVTGVTTTGIYCLPSCSARKPRPENVVFFDGEDAAKRAGLRACRRCRPDRFYREHDPDRERLEAAVARLAADPSAFPDVAALAKACEVGVTKLVELARRHHHASPLELLARARVERACALLADTRGSAAEIGFAVGFESLSAFHDNLRQRTGLAPGEHRRMVEAREFELVLDDGARPDLAFAHAARDPVSPTERLTGARFERVELVDGRPALVVFEHASGRVRVRVESARAPSREAMKYVHALAVRLLALGASPDAFERRVRRERRLVPLLAGREGMRVPRTPSVFEAFVRTVVAQQVNLAFAFGCRRDLVLRAGTKLDGERAAHPTPEQLAELEHADLERLRFSRRKAEFLIDASRAAVAGSLDFEALSGASFTRAAKELGAVRGLGTWSVQSLLMFGCGFADCVPLGDVGLERSLQEFFELDQRPDDERTLELLAPLAPYRSLASLHLWKRLGRTP